MNDTNNFEGEELDIEPYEGEPDFDGPVADEDGDQDDGAGDLQQHQVDAFERGMPADIVGFMAKTSSAPNTWRETLEWYKQNETTNEIGFDPDNMCLKICRTARNIPARFLSAKEAQDATPQEHRIHKVSDLRRTMALYFDDPKDSNRFGHIATLLGRVRGFDKDKLSDLLVATNSVKENELVIVRGDYFQRYWGDEFKFGATWLNGYELDLPNHGTKVERFHDTRPEYDLSILARAAKERPHARKVLDNIRTQVNLLTDSPKLPRVREFKNRVRQDNVLDLRLLNEAVDAGREGRVKRVRDELRRLIETLPDE